MDTAEVADKLGTTPRVLRQFLRSPMSTFVPVGSGARYDFTERELPTIAKRFSDWQAAGKPRPVSSPPTTPQVQRVDKRSKQWEIDSAVWAEEGDVKLEDIRDPRVRMRAVSDARAAEDRLMLQLMALGLHITQLGDQPNGKKK